MKTSKITKVTGNGTWQSQNGLMYKWEVEMENGDIGGCMTKAKEQDKWIVGKEVSYTSETKGNFTNFKLVEQKPAFGGGAVKKDDSLIVAQSSLASACQYYQQRGGDINDVLKTAEQFYQFVMTKKSM